MASLHFPIHHHSSSFITRFFQTLYPKPKSHITLATLSSPQSLTSHVSSSSIIEPSSSSSPPILQEITLPEQTLLQIAQDKLFIPPETEICSEKPPRILKGSNIVLGRYARDAPVVSAEFVKSSVETEACPSDGSPEFALVGRSIVGKSSLVNAIVRRKKLALTSKKPGKTQCINHFRINDSWYLVDFPGYGYASAPNELRKDWNKFTKDYF